MAHAVIFVEVNTRLSKKSYIQNTYLPHIFELGGSVSMSTSYGKQEPCF